MQINTHYLGLISLRCDVIMVKNLERNGALLGQWLKGVGERHKKAQHRERLLADAGLLVLHAPSGILYFYVILIFY